ncbi:hypothetical protein Kpol_1000p27 [Vanderwaltozyma polyspora DSM 70294]|uniref:Uncharacterized protein n=1 Tax=Vanderwaltozyma polyspora (strain ATCC 22028 / DSM 70294 / BCRC 21397 / CBS 2163 / NBRC 10782 / NRRL Y-8283 / UCD 57-17) TaxID=436907 RepID=A7TPW6_VANPO|nr:uncharacterized protein Kpol_1000p27 [Vanderwaltozyma polyspora DSM 70294]EDO15714.1 hypothetical protein Kpol_1000p27 [Vanderwaltozyma polyspora DSM 70294]
MMFPKRFSTPVLKVYWPFFISGVGIYALFGKFADLSANSKEFINDPRNPRFEKGGKYIEQ